MSVSRDFSGASGQPDRLHFYAFASIGGAGPNAMLEILTGSCSRLALWHPDSINIPQHECCWTCFGHGALSTGRSVEGLHALCHNSREMARSADRQERAHMGSRPRAHNTEIQALPSSVFGGCIHLH